MSAATASRAVEALTRAARTEHDFANWLAYVLGQVAGQLGSSDALAEGGRARGKPASLTSSSRAPSAMTTRPCPSRQAGRS
jgi:hypothetical protein